jgi:DNA-binding HxlR family transcriptional regulator
MAKKYDQYCPVAHALELVGERWSLLVIRELMHGPLRYTDLAGSLPGIGTNILASRLRDLEAGGVIRKRRLPPPAASQVYELTPYGAELKPVIHALAHWGARSLGPPTDDVELYPGWLENALRMAVALAAPDGSFEFTVGEELATVVDGEVLTGRVDDPDVRLTTDPVGFFRLVVHGQLDEVEVEGDREALRRLADAVAGPDAVPAYQ